MSTQPSPKELMKEFDRDLEAARKLLAAVEYGLRAGFDNPNEEPNDDTFDAWRACIQMADDRLSNIQDARYSHWPEVFGVITIVESCKDDD